MTERERDLDLDLDFEEDLKLSREKKQSNVCFVVNFFLLTNLLLELVRFRRRREFWTTEDSRESARFSNGLDFPFVVKSMVVIAPAVESVGTTILVIAEIKHKNSETEKSFFFQENFQPSCVEATGTD